MHIANQKQDYSTAGNKSFILNKLREKEGMRKRMPSRGASKQQLQQGAQSTSKGAAAALGAIFQNSLNGVLANLHFSTKLGYESHALKGTWPLAAKILRRIEQEMLSFGTHGSSQQTKQLQKKMFFGS